MRASPEARRVCPLPNSEIIMNTIVSGLLSEGSMPNGSIVDAGAHMGRWSCYYAGSAPDRLVHAIEPAANNVEHMRTYYGPTHPNLRPKQGALGDAHREVDAGVRLKGIRRQILGVHKLRRVAPDAPSKSGHAERERFNVYRLDDLFADEALGFAHLDVEGSELQALRGGESTIRRDRPIFTVEVHVHQDPGYVSRLLSFIDSLGYDSFLIEELCGVRADCRNLINLPRATRPTTRAGAPNFARRGGARSQFHGSAALSLATASRRLFAVDAASISEHAYPCCARGGACCRKQNATSNACCSLQAVSRWLEQALANFDWTGHGINRGVVRGRGRDPRLFAPPIYMKQTEFAWPGPGPERAAEPLLIS